MIRLYVFCSKLEKDLQGTLALELETWNNPNETTVQAHRWRSPDHSRKRRRTEAGEDSNAGNFKSAAGSHGGVVDADGFDDGPDGFDGDQYMDIIKWRDEVVKGGREGRVVSDEDIVLDAPQLQFEGRVIVTS